MHDRLIPQNITKTVGNIPNNPTGVSQTLDASGVTARPYITPIAVENDGRGVPPTTTRALRLSKLAFRRMAMRDARDEDDAADRGAVAPSTDAALEEE